MAKAKKTKRAPKSVHVKLAEALEAEARNARRSARGHLTNACDGIRHNEDDDYVTGQITAAVMALGEARGFVNGAFDIREKEYAS